MRGALKGSMVSKAVDLPKIDMKLARLIGKNKVDYTMGIMNPYVAQSAFFTKKKSFIFNDTETAKLSIKLTLPFCTNILTPSCYLNDLGAKHLRYDGYHELAYLHPNRFKPDPSILDELGVAKGEKFVLIRFVSWAAFHDVGHTGILLENKLKAVKEFAKRARVFITSEAELPKDLREYGIKIPAHRIHDAMHYATLLYGESPTMASECAQLGTPAMYLGSFRFGLIEEQAKKYGTIFYYTESEENQKKSIDKGIELLEDKSVKQRWSEKRMKVLEDKIDVTEYMMEFVEQYPEIEDIKKG
jgi:predicted glycosyltransferase